jgi:septal ring factor EnvC (AmiA/AmiB activator)
LNFAEARGKLPFPAQGQIVRRYGEPDGLGRDSQGLMIATRAGAQVTAPADAKVEFAGPFRSYGQVVILNPGGGYRLLLAGMDKVTADVGEFLRAGEPVGEMGSGPASVTLFGEVVQDGRPVLYIEFRNSTEAVDSGPWWIGGLKEAHG